MAEKEGVIKFELDYKSVQFEEMFDHLGELTAWRTVCLKLGLIGQDDARYDGYGFGNISMRVSGINIKGTMPDSIDAGRAKMAPFLISGTQTGHIPTLSLEQYALVTACQPSANRVSALGPCRPSSESMTHGVVYGLDAEITCVIHAHSPEIWRAAPLLHIPATSKEIPYGTPEMAQAVQALFRETDLLAQQRFVMQGHLDGVVVYGHSIKDAGQRLVSTYIEAIQKS